MVSFAYGNADFADIRRAGAFYVDKTSFLPTFEDNTLGAKNLFFLRPRRFGKSALLRMMEHYYDIALADQYDELFRGLWIYDHPTPEKSKYLVLKFDFSNITVGSTQEAVESSFLEATRSAVRTLIGRHGARVPALVKLEPLINGYRAASDLMANLFGILAGIGESAYVLIDEYDTFANALLSAGKKGLYSDMTDSAGFVRGFYRSIKAASSSDAVARVFITGGTPILLDDLVTGFNIVTNISNREHYNTLAGFTKADVERALDELLRDQPELQRIPEIGDRERLLDTLEKFYDGYRFSPDAQERVFNSTMVIYFLRELAMSKRYPKQMLDANVRTDYGKLHAFWASTGPAAEGRRKIIETLLAEKQVWSPLIERFGTREEPTDTQFVSLMYYTGMLTLANEPPNMDELLFEPPNRVMRDLGLEHYAGLLKDLESIDLRDRSLVAALKTMAIEGNIEPFVDLVRKDVLTALANRDTMNYNEQSMKMLLLGALTVTTVFFVFSEKELGHGYSDLLLVPNPTLRNSRVAWLFELKYLPTDATDKQLADKIEMAEGQLKKYLSDEKYVAIMSKGLELKAGTIVFFGCSRMEWKVYSG